jgi:hypothetical protein
VHGGNWALTNSILLDGGGVQKPTCSMGADSVKGPCRCFPLTNDYKNTRNTADGLCRRTRETASMRGGDNPHRGNLGEIENLLIDATARLNRGRRRYGRRGSHWRYGGQCRGRGCLGRYHGVSRWGTVAGCRAGPPRAPRDCGSWVVSSFDGRDPSNPMQEGLVEISVRLEVWSHAGMARGTAPRWQCSCSGPYVCVHKL